MPDGGSGSETGLLSDPLKLTNTQAAQRENGIADRDGDGDEQRSIGRSGDGRAVVERDSESSHEPDEESTT